MQIAPEIITEILERTDLVALIGRYVSLKPSGRAFLGLCPFHAEKTPSFNVNPQRRMFKCFGCDAGGDAISFLKRMTGQPFVDIVRDLGRQAGVTIEEREDPGAKLRQELREVTAFALRHFQERLGGPHGKAGVDHLRARKVTPETSHAFGLGYALDAWTDLTDRLTREGFLERAVAAGLCTPSRTGERFFDTFRGRLMIPIRSPQGHPIAFGARWVEEAPRPNGHPGPKYLNSKENPLYRKSDVLFGLDLAQETIRREKRAILVEGYFDVMGLHAAGIRNSLALCSTALTPGHLTALERAEAKELVLLLDGDAAGQKAVERLSGPLFASGLSVRVATLPAGADPDTFALERGREGTEALLAEALPLSRHLLLSLLPSGRHASFEEKKSAFARLTTLMGQVPSGITRSLLTGEIADHFALPETEVREALFVAHPPPSSPRTAPSSVDLSPSSRGTNLDPAEIFLAALLTFDPTLRALPEANVRDELTSVALRALIESGEGSPALGTLPPLVQKAFEAKRGEIERTLAGDDCREARKRAVLELGRRIRLTAVESQIEGCKRELAQWTDRPPAEPAPSQTIEALQAELKTLFEARMRFKTRTAG